MRSTASVGRILLLERTEIETAQYVPNGPSQMVIWKQAVQGATPPDGNRAVGYLELRHGYSASGEAGLRRAARRSSCKSSR